MPKPVGSPINITNGQRMREVTSFTVNVSYAGNGTVSFVFHGHARERLRNAQGVVIWENTDAKQMADLQHNQIPAPVRASFQSIVDQMDNLP